MCVEVCDCYLFVPQDAMKISVSSAKSAVAVLVSVSIRSLI